MSSSYAMMEPRTPSVPHAAAPSLETPAKLLSPQELSLSPSASSSVNQQSPLTEGRRKPVLRLSQAEARDNIRDSSFPGNLLSPAHLTLYGLSDNGSLREGLLKEWQRRTSTTLKLLQARGIDTLSTKGARLEETPGLGQLDQEELCAQALEDPQPNEVAEPQDSPWSPYHMLTGENPYLDNTAHLQGIVDWKDEEEINSNAEEDIWVPLEVEPEQGLTDEEQTQRVGEQKRKFGDLQVVLEQEHQGEGQTQRVGEQERKCRDLQVELEQEHQDEE